LERCRPYLTAELGLLRRVCVVITLGRIAHESWLKAAKYEHGPAHAANVAADLSPRRA
jgi:uracil-DNA glycosylase